MKRLFFVGIIISVTSALFLSCGSDSRVDKIYKWKMHTYVPESVNLYQDYMLPFIEEIEKRTNSRLQITPYPVNSIVAPSELLTATAEGVIECAMSTPAYDTGLIPESYIASGLPYVWTDISEPTDFFYNNREAWDIMDKAYAAKDVKLIAVLTPNDPLSFLTMFPVNKVSDFKGKLVRSPGSWSSLVSGTGASQVNMPLSDVYESLEKGVIDGVFMSISGLSDFKWNEVVKYVMMPTVLVSGGADVIVNQKAFNELQPDLQKIFVDTAREMNLTHMIPRTGARNDQTIADAKANGVEFVKLSPDEIAIMYKAGLGMWQEIGAINANTARQLKLIKAYLDAKDANYPGK